MTIRNVLLAASVIAFAGFAQAQDYSGKTARPLDAGTLKGTYAFAGRVLINPSVPPGPGAPPSAQRVPIDCFAIGEFRFNGKGRVKRRVEIRCPTTQNLLMAGLGAPPPVGEPTPQQISVMGSSFESVGRYQLGADGWGSFSDSGSFRLGPVPGNPMTSAGRFTITDIRGGVAREIVVLIDQQSLQGPGAPMLMNSDIGAAFVARRR